MRFKRIFMLFVALLWIFAGFVLVLQLNKEDESAVVAAFNQIDSNQMRGSFIAQGTLKSDYLTGDEQEELLKKMANEIGITKNIEITKNNSDRNRSIELKKQSDSASVLMKIVTYEDEVEENVINTRQYLEVELLLNKYVEEIIVLKNEIEKVLDKSPFQCSSGLEFTAQFDRPLGMREKNKISNALLKKINGKIVSEEKNNELYTIYAYTDCIRDYRLVNDNAINVNIVFDYDELQGVTNFHMATPYMMGEY